MLAARPYADLISTVAAAHHVDARLVHAVIEQESNYQTRARSKKGARGLMQFMPDTARQYGVRNSYDPKANLEAGVRHLKDLMSRLDLPLALAAYNAGEATVRRYGGLPPFPETQAYVRSILRRVGSLGTISARLRGGELPTVCVPPSSKGVGIVARNLIIPCESIF